MKKTKRTATDDEIADLTRDAERLRDAMFQLRDKHEAAKEAYDAANAYLADTLKENGFLPRQAFRCDADLRVEVQPSFTLERRPDASQRALDRVFERVPYDYAKIYRTSDDWKPPTKKRS